MPKIEGTPFTGEYIDFSRYKDNDETPVIPTIKPKLWF
jgi:hypothetical protein